jgi:uncharacterized protein YdhG (YjbR/CyaY superfamily)
VIASRHKFETIEEYINSFPRDTQRILVSVKETIKKSAPSSQEAINYQIPTFRLNGNLVHFAAFKNHIGFYPGSEAIKVFKKEIASYKSSKGAIQFPIDKSMPLNLIRKIVKYRVKVNSAKKIKTNK